MTDSVTANGSDGPSSPMPANVTVISPGERTAGADSFAARRLFSRNFSKASVLLAVAALTGAVGGALSAAVIGQPFAAPSQTQALALSEVITRLDAEVATLRSNIDRAGKARTAQFGKVGERIEKIEKSQEEAATKLSKLGESLEKTKTALAALPTAARPISADVTGSIPPPKSEAKGPQIIHNWILNRVTRGGALVESERGLFEVYPGDPLPGLGRVEAVRYQDGRWVVVTQRGLIVRP